MRVAFEDRFSCRVASLAVVATFLLVGIAVMSSQASAATIDYFSSFGKLVNEDYMGGGGICAAVSYINGAVYLENKYSDVYGGTNLSIGSTTSNQSAARAWSYDGWTVGETAYTGYYMRSENPLEAFWETIVDWTESYASGTTNYSGQCGISAFSGGYSLSTWTLGECVNDVFPTFDFLKSAVDNNEFVEIGVQTYDLPELESWGHAINVLDVVKSGRNTTLYFQDPNSPNAIATASLNTINLGGYSVLQFNLYGDDVFITFAAALEAVPEPGAFVLLTIGSFLLIGYARFRRRIAA